MVALLAALRSGLAVVPLDPAAPVPVVADVLERTRPALVLGDHAARAVSPDAKWMPAGTGADPLGASAGAEAEAGPVPATAEAILLFTSGSTGRPKAVAHTHATVLAGVQALRQAWGITASDRLLHALPMTHAHGLIIALMPLLLAGGRVDLRPRFEPADVAARLPDATCFMGVPFHYAQLLTQAGFDARAAAGVRLFTCGSAPLSDDLRQAVEARLSKPLLERYGMTETLITTANAPGAHRAGSVGRVLPGAALRVRDLDTGELLDTGAEGEVEVRGDFVFDGYLDDPQETGLAFREDGFFRTGDVGRLDADGYLVLSGRAKDLIIYAGLKVHPAEVEAALRQVDGVAEACVFGVPHPSAGMAVTAAVVPAPGADLRPDELRRALVGQLPATKIPKRIHLVAELPRNAMGKLRRDLLRQMVAAT